MKKNQLQEIKILETAALLKKAEDLRIQISGFVMDKHMNKLADLKVMGKTRKDLAQILTIVGQKEAIDKLEKASQKESDESKDKKKGDSK